MATTTWVIDPTHSEIQFKVKHLVISTVTGSFKSFEGTVEADNEDVGTIIEGWSVSMMQYYDEILYITTDWMIYQNKRR